MTCRSVSRHAEYTTRTSQIACQRSHLTRRSPHVAPCRVTLAPPPCRVVARRKLQRPEVTDWSEFVGTNAVTPAPAPAFSAKPSEAKAAKRGRMQQKHATTELVHARTDRMPHAVHPRLCPYANANAGAYYTCHLEPITQHAKASLKDTAQASPVDFGPTSSSPNLEKVDPDSWAWDSLGLI